MKFFSLANSNLQKSYVLRQPARTGHDRFAFCLFNCQTLGLISAFDIETSISNPNSNASPTIFHVLTNNENLETYFALRTSGFLRTLQEIKPDLSGLTGSKLFSAGNGMRIIARRIGKGNRPHTLTGAVIKIN